MNSRALQQLEGSVTVCLLQLFDNTCNKDRCSNMQHGFSVVCIDVQPKSSLKQSILIPDIYFIFFFFLLSSFSFSKPPLILVSLDGFRAEYLKDHNSHLPVINKLRKLATQLVVCLAGLRRDWGTLCCRKGWNHNSTPEACLSYKDLPQPLHHRHREL